jgi:integrase
VPRTKVTLYWCAKTPSGWKRYPAAMGRNGKLRPRYAQVDDEQILFAQGHYELRYLDQGRTVWVNVGEMPSHAQAEHILLSRRLEARKVASEAGIALPEESPRVPLALKAEEFLERQAARGKNRQRVLFRTAINEFLPIAGVDYADQLSEQIILRWYAALRKNGNSNRTIYNKHITLFGFLKWAGVDTKILATRAPSYTEKDVEIYTAEELGVFFDSLNDEYHRAVFEVLLKTGLRMQEAMFLEWNNINFSRGTITVRTKDDLGFDIKDKAERTLPIPSDLVELLKTRKKTHHGRLVLGTSNDTPNWKWLPLLKRLVRQAKLNCGHCRGCVETRECRRWYLHKFRATYTTNLLRAGIDPRTVMKYTGHEDMETIMRYLKPAETMETQEKINSIVWTK